MELRGGHVREDIREEWGGYKYISCIHVQIKKITVKIENEFSWSDLKVAFTPAFPLSSCIIQYKAALF